MTPVDLFLLLMSLALRYPLSLSGGGRTKKRNKLVGGHPNSRHLLWLAWDVVLDDMSPANVKLLGTFNN